MRHFIFACLFSSLFAIGPCFAQTVEQIEAIRDVFEKHLNAGNAAMKQAKFAVAEAELKAAVEVADGITSDMPEVLVMKAACLGTSLNNLGMVYQEEAKFAEAAEVYQRCLPITEKAMPNSRAVAALLSNLAELYRSQGRDAEAGPLLKRSLEITEKIEPNSKDLATGLNNLAALYSSQKNYAEAIAMFKRAMAIDEKLFGADSIEVAGILSNLGASYQMQGKLAEAVPLYQRAVAIHEKRQPDHPQLAASLNCLADAYMLQGKDAQAEALYKRALVIKEKTYGPNHPEIALTCNNMAQMYWRQHRFALAEQNFRKALTIVEKAYSPNHPTVLQVKRSLAELLQDAGKYAQATAIAQKKGTGKAVNLSKTPLAMLNAPVKAKDVEWAKKIVPMDKPDAKLEAATAKPVDRNTASYVVLLMVKGSKELAQSRFDAADTAYAEAVAVLERSDFKDDGNSRDKLYDDALNGRLSCLVEENKDTEALEIARKIIIAKKKVEPSQSDLHLAVASMYAQVGDSYLSRGLQGKAQPCFEKSISLYTEYQDKDPGYIGAKKTTVPYPSIISAMKHLGEIYEKDGKVDEGQKLQKDAQDWASVRTTLEKSPGINP